MKAWESIAGDFEQDKRDAKPGEYSIVAVGGVGRITCYRPGLQLIDFYRTTTVLACEVKPLVPSGTGGVQGDNPHATPQKNNQ